jgi:hypothetical protein
MKSISMREAYRFFDTVLIEGATYQIGAAPGGHELTEERAKRLVAEGWAEEAT